MYRILLVDDDAKNLKATKDFLKSKGYDVETTISALAALEILKTEEFALALLDYRMPEMMGDILATMIRDAYPNQQIAMYSCDLTREAVKTSMKAGALDFIEKTMPNSEFAKAIEGFCQKYEEAFRTVRMEKNKSESRLYLESMGMVSQSKLMVEMGQKIEKLAASPDTSVLVRGESGAGKELVARALHNLSSRASYPFISINCAAIPKDLLESELFGHVRGAFTGATDNKDGKFKLANNGTIFLDEIGDMPLDLQAKLLRVLQERVIEPVGSKISQKINVRVITATHRNLDEMAAKKLFREDLIYRIRVVEVEVPTLRSRPEDIEPLVEHFTAKINKANGTSRYFQRQALKILKRYPWPGNIRELQTTVESHLVLVSENLIRAEHLDRKFFEAPPTSSVGLTMDEFQLQFLKNKLEFIENTIKLAEDNKAEACRRLGVKPPNLIYIMNKTKSQIEELEGTSQIT